jgi:hypothetical protein
MQKLWEEEEEKEEGSDLGLVPDDGWVVIVATGHKDISELVAKWFLKRFSFFNFGFLISLFFSL